MKTIAIIDEFENINPARAAEISEIRQRTGADILVAVMSGNFLQSGLPAEESGHVRARKALEAGVDACVTNEHTAEDISRFLFHLLLGIGKSDIAMSRIPVIEEAETDVLKMNSTCRELFDIDLRASAIYYMVS